MLVFISDVHLTDNAFSGTVPTTPFKIFRERLRDMAYDASWRRDGRYRPIESLELVLLGDVLDMIRSERWPHPSDGGFVRPWSDSESELFQKKVAEIADSILANNTASLEVLRSLRSPEMMTLPPAADGKPAQVPREPNAPERVPVEVRTHYLAGNHDWFLHLKGQPYDAIRQNVIAAMGLAQPANQPFPHDPAESPALLAACRDHHAWFRHGDFFDPMNFEGDRDRSSLGDAIVVDLVDRFAVDVHRKMGDDLPEECVEGLRQIDYVRPLALIPVWVDGLLRRTCPNEALAREVKSVWDGVVDDFLDIGFVRERHERLGVLAAGLKFSQGVSMETLSRLFSWISGQNRAGNDRPSFRDACKERDFLNRRARTIVYGHTHQHEVVPLDVSYSGAGALEQVCLNSGTWRMVHERARYRPAAEVFTNCWVMTYLAVYKDDERGGRPFEAWSGTLALPRALQ